MGGREELEGEMLQGEGGRTLVLPSFDAPTMQMLHERGVGITFSFAFKPLKSFENCEKYVLLGVCIDPFLEMFPTSFRLLLLHVIESYGEIEIDYLYFNFLQYF